MKRRILLLSFSIILFCISCSKNDNTNKSITPLSVSQASGNSLAAGAGQYLGVTCGFQYSAQLTGPVSKPTQENISMYNPDPNNPNETWDDWVEQLAQAGVDFVCPNLTGSQPNTGGSPAKIAPIITAINNRGLTGQIKLAAFDDNAASWCAQWNDANGRGYGYAQPFDMSNSANWKYIYDYNYKIFFQTVPDANRFKINGRPVIFIWSSAARFCTNMQGNASRAITYVRQQCQADFGFNPYIILNQDFFTNDTTCGNAGIADGKHSWFTPPSRNYSLTSYNGASTGIAIPQFGNPGATNYTDPNHGQTFETGLSGTVEAGALITLCEGFTDYEEDAAMWRVRNIDASGNALSYTQTGYDYPNQRLNILRKHSKNPFPATLKLEAEGCDSFGGAAGGNGKTNFYRNGNIAIAATDDPSGGGFHVGWMQSNEWLEWESLPFNGNVSLQIRIANPNANMQAHIEVDGVAQPAKTLPNTGAWGTWTTFDFGSLGTYSNTYHKVRIVFNTGGVNFNWCQLTSATSGLANGTYKIVSRSSGFVLDAQNKGTANGTPIQQYSSSGATNQQWTVTSLGNGQYKIIGVASGRSLDVTGNSVSDGAAIELYDYHSGTGQTWIITPTSGGYYTIKGVNSGDLLDVTGNSLALGALIDQYHSTGGNNQQWAFQAP
jgi:hypothetical protein